VGGQEVTSGSLVELEGMSISSIDMTPRGGEMEAEGPGEEAEVARELGGRRRCLARQLQPMAAVGPSWAERPSEPGAFGRPTIKEMKRELKSQFGC
jgi:hypothetical protein